MSAVLKAWTEPRAAAPDAGGLGALPGVSVLVPARDDAAALPDALRSLAAQDYPGPMEVIVADGSATPATAAATRAALPGVRIVANPGRSAAAGMNVALAASVYPVVLRCDARCTLPPDYVRRAVETLRRTGAANVGGRLSPAGRTPFERAAALAMASWLGSGGPRYRRGGPAGPVETVPLGAFRRDALAAVGGFDASLVRNEDYDVNWRLRRTGGTVWFDPALAVAYRPRGSARALARQYVDYGCWKRVVIARHPRSLKARQLAPPALVLGLAASAAAALAGVLSWAGDPILAARLLAGAAVLPSMWLAALAAQSLWTALRLRRPGALAMAVPVAVMHLAWGAGFLMPKPPAPEGAEDRR